MDESRLAENVGMSGCMLSRTRHAGLTSGELRLQ